MKSPLRLFCLVTRSVCKQGQYTVLSTKGGIVNYGDTTVEITEGARAGGNMFGLGLAITDLLDGAGQPLTNSSVIEGLDFDGYNSDIGNISAVSSATSATPGTLIYGK